MRPAIAFRIGFLALVFLASSVYAGAPASPPVTPPRIQPKTFTVDCSAGQSIQGTLQAQAQSFIAGDILLVSGTCNESVFIAATVNAITLDGQGTATLNGVDTTASVVAIQGRGITLQGFTITGGPGDNLGAQVLVDHGAAAIIQNNHILNAADTSITVQRNSTAKIVGNTIQGYVMSGIDIKEEASARIFSNSILGGGPIDSTNGVPIGIYVRENTSARIGFNSTSDATAGPNLIQKNLYGIRVRTNSSASIVANEITNNSSHGINASRNSHMQVVTNVIQANGGNGIYLVSDSSVELSGVNSTWGSAPNSTSSSALNGLYGISCSFGGYVSGPRGTLSGSSGGYTIFNNCLNGIQ